MKKEKQEQFLMCKMCGDEWVYELSNDIVEREKDYKSLKQNKMCVSCNREFGRN